MECELHLNKTIFKGKGKEVLGRGKGRKERRKRGEGGRKGERKKVLLVMMTITFTEPESREAKIITRILDERKEIFKDFRCMLF